MILINTFLVFIEFLKLQTSIFLNIRFLVVIAIFATAGFMWYTVSVLVPRLCLHCPYIPLLPAHTFMVVKLSSTSASLLKHKTSGKNKMVMAQFPDELDSGSLIERQSMNDSKMQEGQSVKQVEGCFFAAEKPCAVRPRLSGQLVSEQDNWGNVITEKSISWGHTILRYCIWLSGEGRSFSNDKIGF